MDVPLVASAACCFKPPLLSLANILFKPPCMVILVSYVIASEVTYTFCGIFFIASGIASKYGSKFNNKIIGQIMSI